MEERKSFQDIYMEMAWIISKRSTCKRLKVGTLITSTDYRKVLALGYNGNATGLPNKCDSEVPGACGCLHAEENAIINCDSPREMKKYIFCTHLPCKMCAKRIINLGNIKTVFYNVDYRSDESLELFKMAGINVQQIL